MDFLFMNKINIIRVITLVLITMSNLAIGSDGGNGGASYEYEHLLTYLIFDLVVLGVLFVIYRVFYKLKMKT
jgi:hypothetical protein